MLFIILYCTQCFALIPEKSIQQKGPGEPFTKKNAEAIEISRPENEVLFGKRSIEGAHRQDRIISRGFSRRRVYCKYYTHKEINEGFKLG